MRTLKIDHIGIVVKSLATAIEQWTTVFGYYQQTNAIINTRQMVKIVFLEKNGSLSVKLVEPINELSPVFRFAKKGGGLHHLCFKCDDIEIECKFLKHSGLRIITQPEPGEAFDNEKIAFLLTNHGVNIELIETNKRANIINNDHD